METGDALGIIESIVPVLYKGFTAEHLSDAMDSALKNATKRACTYYDNQPDYTRKTGAEVCRKLRSTTNLNRETLTACFQSVFPHLPEEYVEHWEMQFYTLLVDKPDLLGYVQLKINQEILEAIYKLQPKPKDTIQELIQNAAHEFERPMFLHGVRGEDTNVRLCNLYVNPQYLLNGRKYDTMVDTLSDFVADEKKNLLIINGDAATGKTGLVNWLCYHYLREDEIQKKIFGNRPLIHIRLRDLDSSLLKNTKRCIFAELGIEEIPSDPNTVFVLDGADELCMIEGMRSIDDFLVSFYRAFCFQSNRKIIVTSRPSVIHTRGFWNAEKNNWIDWINLSLCRFTKKMREKWLENYQACGGEIADNTRRYIQKLSDEDSDGIADTPIALYLLSQYREKEIFVENPWALYHYIFSNAIVQTPYGSDSHGVSRYAEPIYRFIELVAFQMLKREEDEYITDEDVTEIFNNREWMKGIDDDTDILEKKKEFVKQCCAICAYWKSNGKGAFEFYHNNIRDFFLCEYIYRRIQLCLREENGKKTIDPDQFVEAVAELFPHRPLASTDMEISTWEQTFAFLLYRLRYEYDKKDKKDSLCSIEITEEENPLPALLYLTATNPKILSKLGELHGSDSHLERLKTSYLNTFFLSRIWQEVYREKRIILFIKIWNAEKEKSLWEGNFRALSAVFSYRIRLDRMTLSVASFANLEWANLRKAKFGKGIRTKWIKFEGADLEGADLEGAHLEGADLEGADLEGADLEGADLEGADLEGANLKSAHLEKANLGEANLGGAKLEGAHLEKSINLMWARDMEYSYCLEEAHLPANCYIKKLTADFRGSGPYYEITWGHILIQ